MIPTPIVDIGFPVGVQALPFWHIGDSVRGIIGVAALGNTSLVFTTISNTKLKTFTVERGVQRVDSPLITYDAGTATIVLDDPDGDFDPDNLAGPYVSGGESQVTPMVPVRIRMQYGAVAYPLFYGFADSWGFAYTTGNSDVILHATDAFKIFRGQAGRDLGAPIGEGETPGARVNRILDAAGWPAADRIIGAALNANPYFEANLFDWAAQGGTLTRSTAQFHQGVASGLLTPSGSASTSEVFTTTGVPVFPGRPIVAQMWARCATSRNVVLSVTWYDVADATITDTFVSVPVTANTWTLLTFPTTPVPPAAAHYARLFLKLFGSPVPAADLTYIDDAWITYTDVTTLQATTFEGTALDELQTVAASELGQLYMDGAGRVVFKNRRAIIEDPQSTTSQGIFGSDIAGGELPYADRVLDYDDGRIANQVLATTVGGVQQSKSDVASQIRYGMRTFAQDGLVLSNDAQALDWAGLMLYQSKDLEQWFSSLEIDPRADENALYPHCLGRELADRITVRRRRKTTTVTDVTDTFTRTVSNGWGIADTGQVWTTNGGSASDYSVSGGVGQASAGAVGSSRFTLLGVSMVDVDLAWTMSVPAVATGNWIGVGPVLRYADGNNYLWAAAQFNLSGQLHIQLSERITGTPTNLTGQILVGTYTANQQWRMRVSLSGSVFRVKLWTSAEPATWMAQGKVTALFGAGQIGQRTLLNTGNTNTLPVVSSYDDLRLTAAVTRDCFIRGISHSYGPGPNRFKTTWALQSATRYQFFTVGDAADGQLNNLGLS